MVKLSVSTSLKKKHTKFTLQSLIRLAIFSLLLFFIISFISGQKLKSPKLNISQSSSILGKTTEIGNNIYQSIPENSRKQLENLNQNPAVIFIEEKFNYLKSQTNDFPQKQIKDIQKMLLKNIYENSVKKIDSQ